MVILEVALGAGVGAVMRYLMTMIGKHYWPKLPFATMIINVIGSFVAGFLAGAQVNGNWSLFWLTGVCGGFTTFSTFTTDTFVLLRNKRWRLAITYYLGTIGLGLSAIVIGLYLGSLSG